MKVIKEVENTLNVIKEQSIEEATNHINETISKFNKTKSIKYYLQSLILALNNELKLILNNYSSLRCKDQVQQLNNFKDILRKETIIKGIYKQYKSTKNTKLVDIEEPVYDYNGLEMNLDDTNIKDVIAIFKDMIKNGNFELNQGIILNYVSYLNNIFVHELDYNNHYHEISSILDTLKARIKKYATDSIPRTFFKDIYKQFKDTAHLYDKKYDTNHREKAYLEILNYYINSENYFVIQELLKRKPEICNLKYNDEHIIFYILDLYFENLQSQLKGNSKLNINYLKELYLLFTKSEGFRISYDERKEIDNYLNEINRFIKTTIVKEKRRVNALSAIKEMRPTNFYQKTYYHYDEISDDALVYEKQRILNNVINLSSRYVNEGYDLKNAFVVGNTAYSIINTNHETKLQIHVMNVSPFVSDSSIIKQYAHKFVFYNEDTNKDFFLKGCRYQEGKNYGVITYTLDFYPSGKLKGLSVDKNAIKVNNIYLNFFETNTDIELFTELYRKSVLKNGGDNAGEDIYKMNNHFNNLLNSLYPSFLKKYKIPFIYYGYSKPEESVLLENKNALINYLVHMNKSEAMEILDIITSRIDKWHYTLYPINNAVYDLKLVDSFNYIGIENMRMLNEFYFNSHLVNMQRMEQNKKICYQNLDELVKEFNSYINYVDIENVKHSNKILRRQKF